MHADSINIKILNAGAWSRGSERFAITLPTELEDLIPQVEDYYKKKYNGRKLQWHHALSTGVVSVTHLSDWLAVWVWPVCRIIIG